MDRQRLGQRLKFLANVGVSLDHQEAGIGRVEQERKHFALQALLEKETVNLSQVRDAMVQGTLDSAKERCLCYEMLLGVLPVHSISWSELRRQLEVSVSPHQTGRGRPPGISCPALPARRF